MTGFGDEEITPLRCASCLSKFSAGDGDRCPKCGRILTPHQVQVSRRRSSGTFPGLERSVRNIVIKLRADARVYSLSLADQLDGWAVKLRRWQLLPPTPAESNEAHLKVLELVTAAEKFLAGGLPR